MPHSGHSSPEVLSLVQDLPGWRDGRFMDDRQSNQAADQIRICQVDMQKLEQFPIPNDIYAKFFCNGMLLVGIDSFDFAIFSKQRPSLFKPECFSGFLSRGYAYLRGSRPPAWRC